MGGIGIEPSVSTVEKFSPSFAGNGLRDRDCHHSDGEFFLASGQESVVKSSVFFEATEEIKAFTGGVEEGNLMRVSSQVERFILANGSEYTKRRVTQVANDQISLSDNVQDERRGALVVTPVRSELI